MYRKNHISMYFLRKIIFHFLPNILFSGKKIPSFQIIEERSYSITIFLKRPSFQNIWRKYHISMYFFREILSFIFRLKNKIIFSGKRNIVFPDNTRKILFQCDFFGKTIFSGRLEKENMVFGAVAGAVISGKMVVAIGTWVAKANNPGV